MARELPAGGPEPAVHYVRTRDGWRLGLSRYSPGSPGRSHPVLLVPGLAANRNTFDLDRRVSLARWLATRGWDVWCLELRNHGRSDRVRRGSRRYGWCFDDHVRYDLPPAIESVRNATGASALQYVGHSMGGLLLYAYLAHFGSESIRSGIAIGASLDYSTCDSDFHALRRLQVLTRWLQAVPIGALARLSAPFAARVHTRALRFNVCPTNVDGALYRRLLARNFHSVSGPVLAQLATAFDPGGLRHAGGGGPHGDRYMDGLTRVRVPVLAVAGSRDRQCPPSAARRTVGVLGAHGHSAIFGRDYGHSDDYGHFDLVIGRRASAEVWPTLAQWLDSHDRPGEPSRGAPNPRQVR